MFQDQEKRLAQGSSKLAEILQQRFRSDFDLHKELLANLPDKTEGEYDWLSSLPVVWSCSNYCARLMQRRPGMLADLIETGDLYHPYDQDKLRQRLSTQTISDVEQLKSVLRRFRQREMLRIAWRDLAKWSELEQVLTDLSTLAEVCIDTALGFLYKQACQQYGTPIGAESGQAVAMVVLAMGKLGGGELNFSSDIDLMFAYEQTGNTDGDNSLSNNEFFLRLSKALINTLHQTTEDGFVFRVDMRLRPNGASGPMALNFDAMELYYQNQGREWERYALIKARAVAGDIDAGNHLLQQLRPFIYRKYIDFGVIESVRDLKKQIESELKRKDIQNNIKLGPGGIREIEFVTQAFQLIHGGRKQSLQQPSLLTTLPQLSKIDYLTEDAVTELLQAYHFLRNVENRLQMIDDQQTHVLPEKEETQIQLANAMGFAGWSSFYDILQKHSQQVHRHFSQTFVAPQREQDETTGLVAVWLQTVDEQQQQDILQQAGFEDVASVLRQLDSVRNSSLYRLLSVEGRQRLDQLFPLLISASGLSKSPGTTLSRVIRIIQAIGRRTAYHALLVENPMAISQLIKLCSASAWITDWIGQHPVLLDELLAPANLYMPLGKKALQQELKSQVITDDLEVAMNQMREFKNSHILRVAAADIGPGLPPEEVGRHLSELAESILQQVHDYVMALTIKQYGRPYCQDGGKKTEPSFIVVAYGKLGSRELGYTSDLDIIFLHSGCEHESGTEGEQDVALEVFYARLAQRFIHFLNIRTTSGMLYEVDTRLRPSGHSGLLVTSIDAFLRYQTKQAWTWEHQALVRARAVVGDTELAQKFGHHRQHILCQQRDPDSLKKDIVAMREKMRDQLETYSTDMFDLKQGCGGIVDIEFMVQYWVLLWAKEYPELTEKTDNIGILKHLAELGLLPRVQVQFLVDAYRQFLTAEHHSKLLDGSSQVRREEIVSTSDGVVAIWQELFGVLHT